MDDILEEIQNEPKMRPRPFISAVNQPNLIALNSTNSTNTTGTTAFSTFTIDLPRPILQADSIQLVNANVPNCVPNIPDTALVFWYYRLNAYSGDLPSTNNLHCVRLLPSYYKQEFIDGANQYGYNQTFPSYQDVAAQLSLAVNKDLANDEWLEDSQDLQQYYSSLFYPYDITLTYNSAINKFQFNGLNMFNCPAFLEWVSTTNYYVGQKVFYLDPTLSFNVSYTCIQDNINEEPTTTTGFWIEDNQPIIQEWDATLNYGPFRVVEWQGYLYQSKLIDDNDGIPVSPQPPNIALQPDTNPTRWEVVPEGFWFANRIYNADVIIFYQLADGTAAAYKSLQNNNLNNDPDTSPTFWQRISFSEDEWEDTETYSINQRVEYEGLYYISLANGNLNNQPDTSPLSWGLLLSTNTPRFVWNRYLSTGYDDPNVATLQSRSYRLYDDSTLFEDGDDVVFGGVVYKANKQTKGLSPPSADWDVQSSAITTLTTINEDVFIRCDTTIFAGLTVGDPVYIFETSDEDINSIPTNSYQVFTNDFTFKSAVPGLLTLEDLTFDETTNGAVALGGFVSLTIPKRLGLADFSGQFDYVPRGVEGVPSQPFSLSPKRLLNSILGFTFNGQFSPSDFLDEFGYYNINEPIVVELKDVGLFNRLRPIQQYITAFTQLASRIVQVPNPSKDLQLYTGTYTADGYANLVYSSIISIYASAVGGSTLDTQDNTNLIAQGTMNAGNLGVSFFAPYVDTPLLLGGEDIYTLSFTLRDECNDPFVLTNNAVVSIVLKVTYKK